LIYVLDVGEQLKFNSFQRSLVNVSEVSSKALLSTN